MNTVTDTVIIVHDSTEWRTSHRRDALLALAETLPGSVAIICVNRPIDPVVTLLKHTRKFWRGIWTTKREVVSERFVVITPRLILHERLAARIPGFTAANRRCMASQLRSVIKDMFPCAQRVIQWIHHPCQHWVFGAWPGCGKVYHCYDEYACTADGVFHPDRWAKEEEVLREAGLTFVTSPTLLERRRPVARRSHLLPNGVPDFFLQPGSALSSPLDTIPPPRILYFGSMYTFLDYPMLETVFGRRPEWQLVMIGPKKNLPGIRSLEKLPNVHFRGYCPLTELHGIMDRFSVGLMPYIVNPYSLPLTPLKLFIYLAAGLPVVSTRLPDLEPYDSIIRLVDDEASAFEGAIDAALKEDRNLITPRLQAEARRHTWTAVNREMVVPVLSEVFGI